MKRKTKRIFSLLLALAVMATMMAALPLTASAATLNDLTKIPAGEDGTKSEFIMQSYTTSGDKTADGYFGAKSTFNTGSGKSLVLNGETISFTGWNTKNAAAGGLGNAKVYAFIPGELVLLRFMQIMTQILSEYLLYQ